MDHLARQYKRQYYEAETLALQGKDSDALDILWELRLKPDLGLYRRAVVNLLISSVYTRDREIFANEAIHLVDIIRKEEDYNSPNLDRIEKLAQMVLGEVASLSTKAVANPATGLLSAPPSSPLRRKGSLATDLDIAGGKLETVKEEGQDEAAEDEVNDNSADEGVIVGYWTSTSEIEAPDPDAFYGSDARQHGIEGYLRDSYYPTRAESLAYKARQAAATEARNPADTKNQDVAMEDVVGPTTPPSSDPVGPGCIGSSSLTRWSMTQRC